MTLDVAALYAEMALSVGAYFGRRVPPVDADDLASAVWLKVVAAAPRYRDFGAPHAWLWTIARNVYRDYLALKRRGEVPLDGLTVPVLDRTIDLLPLYDALWQLQPDQRRLLAEHYAGGYDQNDLADRFGVTVEAIKKRKRRALGALRCALEVA